MNDSTLISNDSFESSSNLPRKFDQTCRGSHESQGHSPIDADDENSSIASLTMTHTYDIHERSLNMDGPTDHRNQQNDTESNNTFFVEKCKSEYDQLYNSLVKLTREFLQLFDHSTGNIEHLKMNSLLPVDLMQTYHRYSSNVTSVNSPCTFHYKLWKKHYCMMLDAVDVIFKDLHSIKNQHNAKTTDLEVAKLVENMTRKFGKSIIRSENSTYGLTKIEISCSLLTDLINQCRVFRGELERQNAVKERLFYILKTAKEQRSKLKIYVTNLKNDLNVLLLKTKQCPSINSCIALSMRHASSSSDSSEMAHCERDAYEQKIQDLERILKEEEMRRKKLHNRLQELIGNIRVYCRIRPYYKSFLKVAGDDKLVLMAETLSEKITHKWYGQKSKCFIFDRVFRPESSQQEVFNSVEELITSCVDGYNVCIMAYGQTGSGKTHTMMGTVEQPGVNRRAVQRLLEICSARECQWRYRLFVSMVEVYQEEVRDLLNTEVSVNMGSVKIMSGVDDEVNLYGLTEHEVSSTNDVLTLFSTGERSRTVGATLLNEASSRSHLAVFLRVSGENCVISGARSTGTLTLCDLAGAESASKSGATGERLCEASKINRSLTSLGRVFDALRRHQKPAYRESKLTYLLKPTLGGDAKCLLIVNLRGEPEHAEESLRAIQFGSGAMQVAPEKAQYRSKVRQSIGTLE